MRTLNLASPNNLGTYPIHRHASRSAERSTEPVGQPMRTSKTITLKNRICRQLIMKRLQEAQVSRYDKHDTPQTSGQKDCGSSSEK